MVQRLGALNGRDVRLELFDHDVDFIRDGDQGVCLLHFQKPRHFRVDFLQLFDQLVGKLLALILA